MSKEEFYILGSCIRENNPELFTKNMNEYQDPITLSAEYQLYYKLLIKKYNDKQLEHIYATKRTWHDRKPSNSPLLHQSNLPVTIDELKSYLENMKKNSNLFITNKVKRQYSLNKSATDITSIALGRYPSVEAIYEGNANYFCHLHGLIKPNIAREKI